MCDILPPPQLALAPDINISALAAPSQTTAAGKNASYSFVVNAAAAPAAAFDLVFSLQTSAGDADL